MKVGNSNPSGWVGARDGLTIFCKIPISRACGDRGGASLSGPGTHCPWVHKSVQPKKQPTNSYKLWKLSLDSETPFITMSLTSMVLNKSTSRMTKMEVQSSRVGMWVLERTSSLIHWGRVTHMCVSKLTIIGSDNGNYLNQCRYIVNWTLGKKIQWNRTWHVYVFIHENAFETVVRKMAAILSQSPCGYARDLARIHGMARHSFPSTSRVRAIYRCW